MTFTDTLERGKIIVDKVTDPSGHLQEFEFVPSWDINTFFLADADTPYDSGPLLPGTYSVSEIVPAGWTLTNAECDDGSDPNDIGLDPGETVIVTFTDTLELGEGCTPGFWQGGDGVKLWNTVNDSDWAAAGGEGSNPFIHTALFNSFFNPVSELDGLTMMDLVGTGGGPKPARKAARNLVAAYLNVSFGMNYLYTTSELVSMWTAAVAGGNSALLALHTELDAANNLGCPIK